MNGKNMKNEEKKTLSKTSKLASVLVTIMMITVVFSVVLIPNVKPTTVTKVDAPAAYVKQSQTNVLVMNFTVTTEADTKLAGKTPTAGTILEASGQPSDWGNSSVGTAIILCYNPVGSGEYNWRTDCIWQENASNPNTNYNSIDTIINGTAPSENTVYSWLGCRAPQWTRIKTYDASNGGLWNAATDAIINESGDNNNCWLDQLNAVTVNLSSCNASNSDISTVSLWVESNAQTGFQSGDTRLKTVTSGTSWNLSGITQAINLSATFYVTLNISGTASHHKTIKMQIPTLYDANSNGAYSAGDRGLFLASTDDTGNILNANFLTIDSFAPITFANAISGYWKKLSLNPLTITGTASDNCSGLASVALYYRYSSNNNSWGSPVLFGTDSTPWSGVSYSFNFTTLNGSGYYGFFTRGTDNVSNVESARNTNDTTCGFDISLPDSTINSPSNNGKNNSVTNISGVVSDTISGPASVTITIFNDTDNKYWDGGSWETSATGLTTTLHSTIWYKITNLPTWTSGKTYIINSTGTDVAGNIETSPDSNSFVYDAQNPTVTITIPTDVTWYNAMTNITGTANDAGGAGIDLVNITIYNATAGTGHKYWNGTTWSAVVVNFTVAGTTSWYKASGLPTWTNASTYYINATAKDNAGNVGTKHSHTMYVDKFNPRSTVTTISPYWKTALGNLTISYTTITDAGSGFYNVTLYYRYSNNNVTWGGWVASNVDSDPWKTQSWSFNFANGSGFYEYYSRARDNGSNFELDPSNNDTIAGYDVVNPTATITIPVNGGYYRTGSIINTNITGTANDAEGILKVNLTIYNSTGHKYWNTSQGRWIAYAIGVGNITVNLTGSGATRGWYFSNPHLYPTWSTSNVYIINASAKDGASNWEFAADSNSFTYDTTAPAITDITAPINVTWYNALTNVTGTASDAGGLSLVNITIYNSTGHKYWNGTTWSAVVVNTTATGTTSWYRNGVSGLPTWANGTTYFVNATPKDLAGNVGTKHSHTFYIDTTAPISQVTAISGYWKTGSITITATAPAHAGSGLKNVSLYYYSSTNNQTFTGPTLFSVNSSPWIGVSWSFNFTNGSGFYQFYTRATDNATNTESVPGSRDAFCGYDTSNPQVTISIPEAGDYYNSMAQLSGNCSDTGYSGIKSVNLTLYNSTGHKYYDGSIWKTGTQWLGSTIQEGYLTWVYNTATVTWTNGSTYYVNATAVDNATRTSTVDSNSFIYDSTGPTCSIAYNNARTYYNDADFVRIYANFSTLGGSGINESSVKISINYSGGIDLSQTLMNKTNNTHWYYNLNVPGTSAYNGRFTVNITAKDNSSNALNPDPKTDNSKYIDNTQPNCTIAYNRSATYFKAGTALKIWVNFTEATSGINPSSVTMNITTQGLINDTHNTTLTQTNNLHWYTNWVVPSGLNDGAFTVKIYAADNATNLLNPYPTTNNSKKIDNTAPTSSVNTIASYWKTSSPLTITATRNDGGSGLKNVTLYYYNSTNNITFYGPTLFGVNSSPWIGVSWSFNFPAGNGYYRFYSRAADNASNVKTAPVANDTICGYDSAVPFSSVDPITPYWKTTTPITITATAGNGASGVKNVTLYYRFSSDNITWGLNTSAGVDTASLWSWSFDFSTKGGAGYYRFYSIACDNATNTESSPGGIGDTKCGYDYTRPACTIQYNRSATYFKAGTALKIWVNFTEATSGINPSSVTMNITTQGLINDTHNTTLTQTNNLHWYKNWVVPSGSNDGAFTVKIYASDNATNLLNPYPTTNNTKKIDNTAPTCTIGYNNSRTYFKAGEALKIYANFTETGSGMNNASVTIRINTTAGNGNLSNTTMLKTDYTHYYYGWTIPSGTDDSGTFTVRIYAQDNVTNALNPYPTTNNARKIDNTPPTCTVAYNRTSTYFKAGVALKIFANFTEAESGMNDATVKIKINTTAGNGNLTNTTMTKTDATHYYHSWTIPSGSDDDGTFTVRIYAQDNATLYLSPYPTTNSSKIIDNTPPTLSYAVLDADNDGTNYTYVDVYFSETTMDTTTEAYTDFNISESGVGVAAIQNKSGNRVTLRFNTTFQTGDSPTVGIAGSVADLAGNTLTSGTKTINTFRTSLKSGLNLISLPADTSTTTISTVVSGLSGTVTIWRYNANNDTWSSWVKTVSGDTFRLQPGRGYWFNMGTAGTLTGNYNLWPDPGYAPPSTTLTGQKWNLVGHFQSYNQSASTSYGGALASLSDSDVGSLWRYNTGGGYTNILNGAQDMQPGQGYWLFKESSGDKLYTPS